MIDSTQETEMARKHIQDLIGRIYDGTIDDAAWTGIANELAQVFSATSAVLKLRLWPGCVNPGNVKALDKGD